MRQLYILKCALTQKLRQLLCPSSHTTFHWAPHLSLSCSLTPSLSPVPLFSLFPSLLFSVVFLHGICGGAMAKVQPDSHWIICLGIVALFRFPFSFHVLLFFSFFPLFSVYLLLLHESWARKCWSCTGAYRFRQLMWHRQLPAQIWKTESLPKTKSSKNKKILCNR